mgnify:CR=1 FL=1
MATHDVLHGIGTIEIGGEPESCTASASLPVLPLPPPRSSSLPPASTRRSRAASTLPPTARVSVRRSQPFPLA